MLSIRTLFGRPTLEALAPRAAHFTRALVGDTKVRQILSEGPAEVPALLSLYIGVVGGAQGRVPPGPCLI